MYTLGIIEESLMDKNILDKLQTFLFLQRTAQMPADEISEWHINEYHVPSGEMANLLPLLTDTVKHNWYIHAFNGEELIVILKGRFFNISREKDSTWDAMIEYGLSVGVKRHYLESVPLSV